MATKSSETAEKRHGLTHANKEQQRNQNIWQVERQETNWVRRAPFRFAKEFHTKNNDPGDAGNEGGVDDCRELYPVASSNQRINQHDVKRRIDEGGKSRDKAHPDWRVQEQRIVHARVGVVPLGQDVRAVGRLHDAERGNRVADNARNKRPAEEDDEDEIKRALTKSEVCCLGHAEKFRSFGVFLGRASNS